MAGTFSGNKPDGAWADYLPSVILSHPQMGENIGGSARAMKNCGLSRLHIVNPRDGWPNPLADAMAAGGIDILASAEIHAAAAEAAAPYSLIAATTARPRGVGIEALSPRDAALRLYSHARAGGKTALLFGGERSGLDNAEIALADILITVPLNPQFSSLNLAQAVLLMGWECRMAAMMGADSGQDSGAEFQPLASNADKQFFFQRLEDILAAGDFFTNRDMQPVVMRNITAMFNRGGLTEQELRTLHGMVKAIIRSAHKS